MIFGMKRTIRDVIYRSLGSQHDRQRSPQRLERLGCGFMKKTHGFDYVDYLPNTYSVVLVLDGRGSYSTPGEPRQQLEAGWAFERLIDQPQTTTVEGGDWHEVFIDFGPSLAAPLSDLPFFIGSRRCWRPGILPGWVRTQQGQTATRTRHRTPTASPVRPISSAIT